MRRKLVKTFTSGACSLLVAFMLFSCATPDKIAYFQDTAGQDKTINLPQATIRLQPGDMVSIVVNTKDPESAGMLNLPYITQRLGAASREGSYNNAQMSGYTLDPNGDVDFPIVGKINLNGLTRSEASAKIKKVLLDNHLVSDVFNPVVTVEFMNLGISIMGEVARPGHFALNKDNLNILDALSMAGDLTIYGNRENVRVIRTEGDVQKTYNVDLTSAESTLNSPVYYLKQDDIIYVEPNDVKMRQSTVNGNNVRSTAFWISLASLFATIINIIIHTK
ncbi:MAG: polysaccharide biosynthesis/export family protein [Bacteroidales bacterium]|nr:polysaccharide biosynthesis/export family protein [Bacteroidales bacterium]